MNLKSTILLIEDEKNICRFIATTLEANHYRVFCAITGQEGLSLIASRCPDLILLDLGLPDMDGCEIISQVRKWSQVPIIVISARIKEQEKVNALDLGADDYITKPFGTDELLARIRTSLRRSCITSENASRYQANGLVIDFDKHRVSVNDTEIHLTQIEYKLLCILAQNSGKVMTYSSIMEKIWGPYIDSNNRILRVNMANIRRKIEQNPAQPQYIFTEVGIGYRILENSEH